MTELPLEMWKQWIRGGVILLMPQNRKSSKQKEGHENPLHLVLDINCLIFSQYNLMTMPSSFFSVFWVVRIEDSCIVYYLRHVWWVLCTIGSGHSQVSETVLLRLYWSIEHHTKSKESNNNRKTLVDMIGNTRANGVAEYISHCPLFFASSTLKHYFWARETYGWL